MEFVSQQPIRFDDVDGAGIVYYPRFFHLCHKAFEDWFNDKGPVSYPKLIGEQRKGFPTVAISSDFSSPLSYGDVATVSLTTARIGNTSLATNYTISNQLGRPCFKATIKTVYLDLNSKKSLPIPPDLRAFFEKYS